MGPAGRRKRGRPALEALHDAAVLVLGLVLLLCIPLTFIEAERDLRAAGGGGIPGMLVVEREDCGGKYSFSCRHRGTWTSDDGSIVLTDMELVQGTPSVGDTVHSRVLPDEGDSGAAYPLDYARGVPAWAWSFLFLPLGGVFVVTGVHGIREGRVTGRG